MDFAITPPPQAFIPVVDGDPFPVRRIYCVGRNYAAHAREMGHDPDREPPFFFMKPADALTEDGTTIPYPPATADLHQRLSALGKDYAQGEKRRMDLEAARSRSGLNLAP